ncbi:hypothetical protein KBC40_02180 [Patescibacteria group bacterium]|nr:hypothetical protein [Patescibacteria group bacterium]
MTKDEIITALEKEGLRPATPSEVVEFGLAYPEHELITTHIIALDKLFNVNGELKAVCIYYGCINTIHTDGVLPTGFYAAVPVK